MPSKEYYLKYRQTFVILGYHQEVQQLDVYYNLVFLFDKDNHFIKVL